MCSCKTAIAGQHVAILTGFLVIRLVGTVCLIALGEEFLPRPNHRVGVDLTYHWQANNQSFKVPTMIQFLTLHICVQHAPMIRLLDRDIEHAGAKVRHVELLEQASCFSRESLAYPGRTASV